MADVLGYDNFPFIQKEILAPLQLNNTFGSLSKIDIKDVISDYHVAHYFDLKTDEHDMLATAEEVGTFLRALNDGSVFKSGEQEIYASIYKYEHAG